MKKLLFLMLVLTLSTACNKKDFDYTIQTTSVDGTNMYVELNDQLVYSGPRLSEYKFTAKKGFYLKVNVFVADPIQGGSYPTQGTTITLKRGKKVLTETNEDMLVW